MDETPESTPFTFNQDDAVPADRLHDSTMADVIVLIVNHYVIRHDPGENRFVPGAVDPFKNFSITN